MPSPRWFGLVPAPRRPFRPTLETLDTRDLPSVSFILPVAHLQAVAGTPFSGTVAVVLDAALGSRNGSVPLRKLHATIHWGDGHTTAGTLVRTDAAGDLAVTGTNTFLARQTFPVTVSVRDDRNHSTVSTRSWVSVAGMTPPSLEAGPIGSDGVSVDGTLALTPVAVHATTGQRFTGVVGVVHDSSGSAPAASLSAVVEWGDGSPVEVAPLQQTAPGIFQIVGSHSYSFPGSGAVQIWVEDLADGRSATAAANLTVTGGTTAPQTTPAAAVVLTTTASASAPAPGSAPTPEQSALNGQSRSVNALDTAFVWEMTGSGRHRSWQVRPAFPVWRTAAGRVR